MLQKLGSQLASGTFERDQISELLGLAPARKIGELLETLREESAVMFRSLETLRGESSEEAIRAALLRWLRREVSAPNHLPDRNAAADLLEMLLRSPQDSAWLDLFMVRASEFTVQTPQAAKTTVIKNVNKPPTSTGAVAAPSSNTRQVADAGGPQRPVARPKVDRPTHQAATQRQVPAPAQPSTQSVQAAPTGVEARPTHPVIPVVPQDSGPAIEADRALIAHSPEAAAFIAAINRADPDLGIVLSQCTVTVGENVDIRATGSLHGKVELGMRTLRLAAGRAGLGVVLH
jgi:hypothetical protein